MQILICDKCGCVTCDTPCQCDTIDNKKNIIASGLAGIATGTRAKTAQVQTGPATVIHINHADFVITK